MKVHQLISYLLFMLTNNKNNFFAFPITKVNKSVLKGVCFLSKAADYFIMANFVCNSV